MDIQKQNRISELTRISRERALTAQEQQEREQLRQEYIAQVRKNLKASLELITDQKTE